MRSRNSLLGSWQNRAVKRDPHPETAGLGRVYPNYWLSISSPPPSFYTISPTCDFGSISSTSSFGLFFFLSLRREIGRIRDWTQTFRKFFPTPVMNFGNFKKLLQDYYIVSESWEEAILTSWMGYKCFKNIRATIFEIFFLKFNVLKRKRLNEDSPITARKLTPIITPASGTRINQAWPSNNSGKIESRNQGARRY